MKYIIIPIFNVLVKIIVLVLWSPLWTIINILACLWEWKIEVFFDFYRNDGYTYFKNYRYKTPWDYLINNNTGKGKWD